MEKSTIAYLISKGFSPDEIEDMANGGEKAEEKVEEQAEDKAEDKAEEKAEDNQSDAIAEISKTVQELKEVISSIQSDNAKKAKGGKSEKKNSADVIKDFFGQS